MAKGKAPVPDDLTPQEKRRLMAWVKIHFPHWYSAEKLRWLVGECLDYWGARENPRNYSDWVRVCQNRIRDIERRGWNPFENRDRGDTERPQERARRRAELEPLSNVIELRGIRGR